MKNWLIAAFITCTLLSCRKPLENVQDYFPKVQTVSATVLPDGSVEVKGLVISEGASKLSYIGFCYDTVDNPNMLKHQQILDTLYDNIFTAKYKNFDIYKKYYFRTWAANGLGYSYGNTVSLDSIKAIPVVAPCSPTMNTVSLGGGIASGTYYQVDVPSQGFNEWTINATASNSNLTFTFGERPVTKIYKTVQSTSPGPDQVDVYFYSGFISGSLSPGSSVYVNQINQNSWEITICNAPWSYNGGSPIYFTTKFSCPLP